MIEEKDLNDLQDVKKLVDTFYTRVRGHKLLAPIFEERIKERWPEHLDKMYRFWQTVLLTEHTYNGSPFPPHANLPVNSSHFNAWKELFNETIDELFKGQNAENAKFRAAAMAEMFLSKIEYSRNNPFKSIQ
ncbi:MAG: globin [Sphingobacteriales bacterium]|nr:globin [Sphingobacteriales bacterium]